MIKYILMICLLAAGVLQAEETRQFVAVLDLEPMGVPQVTAQILSNEVRAALFNTGKFKVMNREDMQLLLGEQAFQQTDMCSERECAVKIGGALGVEKMVMGSIGKLGSIYAITLKLIDLASSENEVIVNEKCECQEQDLFGAVDAAVGKLTGLRVTGDKKTKPSGKPDQRPDSAVAGSWANPDGPLYWPFLDAVMGKTGGARVMAPLWSWLTAGLQVSQTLGATFDITVFPSLWAAGAPKNPDGIAYWPAVSLSLGPQHAGGELLSPMASFLSVGVGGRSLLGGYVIVKAYTTFLRHDPPAGWVNPDGICGWPYFDLRLGNRYNDIRLACPVASFLTVGVGGRGVKSSVVGYLQAAVYFANF